MSGQGELFPIAPRVSTLRGWAVFSPCGLYRYVLGREWDATKPRYLWLLLNPSKAGAEYDENDPTARKVIGFSQRNGAGSCVIVNPNALIATHPKDLVAQRRAGVDVVGPDNAMHIERELERAHRVIVGWGTNIDLDDRDRAVELLGDRELWSLGMTQDGEPCHPLTLAYATPLDRWFP